MGDGNRDATLGGAIELGEHDTGDASDVRELPCLGEAVLPDRRIEDEQNFVWRAFCRAPGDATNLLELAHQVRSCVQAAGGVHEDRIAAAALPD